MTAENLRDDKKENDQQTDQHANDGPDAFATGDNKDNKEKAGSYIKNGIQTVFIDNNIR